MSTTVVGRAARMTGLKKPRPLRRGVEDDPDISESSTTELESKMRSFNLIQSRAADFMNSSPPCDDKPESPVKTSVIPPHQSVNQNFNKMASKPPLGFQKLNIVSDTNNNTCPEISITLKNRPQGFPHPQREVKVDNKNCGSDTPKGRKNTSFTAIINLKGDDKDERLVLASTCMKSILKAANLLACHMNGELVYIDSSDGDSPEVDMQKEKQLTSPLTEFSNYPSRRDLQTHMPDLPDLVRPDYGRCEVSTSYVATSQHDWRFVQQYERRNEDGYGVSNVKETTEKPSLQYTVKDLLMLAKKPHAKLPPRNWSLIKEAFPELVAYEDRYFEPLDLKACSPHALGQPKQIDLERTVNFLHR